MQVLEHAKESGHELKIELKGPNTEKPVIELVEKVGVVDQCTFSSFYHDRIKKVRDLRPQRNPDGTHVYRTGALFTVPPDNFVERAKEIDASEVHLRYDTCTKDRVEAIHKAGLDSMSWFRGPVAMKKDVERFQDLTDEDETMYEMVLQSGVQAMCVNHPKRLVRLVSNIEDEGCSASDEEEKTN